ncbi:MAG TPA: hypothetical protein VHL14_07275, partial [Steroidobacteraceae bacterium]|nr:hypothetical protein [Steroidobacteraceae bacterium]
MNFQITAALLVTLVTTTAMAADDRVANDVQRNVNQQQRIEQGLQSGELTTREAGKLEREQSRVERTEKRDLRDGSISNAEQRRLTARQNRVSRDIARQKHDAQTGNPDSASSHRMQTDVQRNVNQQQRIQQGAESGTLNNYEIGNLERGQAHVDRREARAAMNGRIGAAEQAGVQR